MNNSSITQILTIFLVISVLILFSLVVVFIVLSLKNRKQEKENEAIKVNADEKNKGKIVQTKMYMAEDIKRFMEFDEIKDNMIVQKNGKRLVMVVQCQGINYDLMSSIEKVGVEQGFVQFLNSLTRPIQIYIQSRKVNLEQSIDNYNKRLKNIEVSYNKAKMQYEQAQKNPNIDSNRLRNIRYEYVRQKNLYDYTKDIIKSTENMSLNKNILTKKYYIAISYYPENPDDLFKKEEIIDLAFSELYTSAQSILRTLSMCDITGKVLNSEELADLLYVAYNRDSSEIFGVDRAIRAGYDSLYTTAPDVIDKKMQELDKLINERAIDLANEAIDTAALNSQKKRELELKEKNMNDLIEQMAKSMIEENRGYIPDDIVEESIKEIDKAKTTKNETKDVKKTRRTSKKGA